MSARRITCWRDDDPLPWDESSIYLRIQDDSGCYRISLTDAEAAALEAQLCAARCANTNKETDDV